MYYMILIQYISSVRIAWKMRLGVCEAILYLSPGKDTRKIRMNAREESLREKPLRVASKRNIGEET